MVRGGRAIPPTENSYLFVFVWEFPLLLFLISNAKPVTWNSDFRTLLGSTGEKVSSTEPRTPASNGTDHQPMRTNTSARGTTFHATNCTSMHLAIYFEPVRNLATHFF